MKKESVRLVWMDLEMSGLNFDHDVILEIATLVTDNQLNILAEGPNIAIHHPESVLQGMDAWCVRTHGASGLSDKVRQSTFSEAEAEAITLAFLKEHITDGAPPLCGNSICTDRRFLTARMPQLDRFFHYRHVDVSTVKELMKRWKPKGFTSFKKEAPHEALADIRLSIEELKHYRQWFVP